MYFKAARLTSAFNLLSIQLKLKNRLVTIFFFEVNFHFFRHISKLQPICHLIFLLLDIEPSPPPSQRVDAPPQVVVPQFDLQELINRAAEQQQELDDDPFTYTVQKMGVPNLNLRPTKSIIKNLSLVQKETRGLVITNFEGAFFQWIFFF